MKGTCKEIIQYWAFIVFSLGSVCIGLDTILMMLWEELELFVPVPIISAGFILWITVVMHCCEVEEDDGD